MVLCLGSIGSGSGLKRLRRYGHGRDPWVQGQWFIHNTTPASFDKKIVVMYIFISNTRESRKFCQRGSEFDSIIFAVF